MQAHNCSSPLVKRGLLGSWDLLLDEEERPIGHGRGRNGKFAILRTVNFASVGNSGLDVAIALHHGQELIEVKHCSTPCFVSYWLGHATMLTSTVLCHPLSP